MQSSAPARCTRCQAPLSSPLICTACRTLHTPDDFDYFELFGVPRKYEMDAGRLTAAFRAVARQIHPDRFAAASEESRTLATQLTARINEAYALLSDPVARANYLLELAGGPSAIEVRDVPGTLLMEIMELRERIEEARAAGDHEAMTAIRSSVLEQKQQTLDAIAARADALATADEARKKEFRKLLNAMRYFENLMDELAVDPLATTGTPAS